MLKYLIYITVLFLIMPPSVSANDTANNIHILYYENIEVEEDPYQISSGLPLENFKQQLAFFKSEAYEVIDFAALQQLSITGQNENKKYVIIILNGNDQTALKYALPLTKRYGYPVEISANFKSFDKNSTLNFKDTKPILNLSNKSKDIDLIAKILNDETSRFRESIGDNSKTLMLNDFVYNDTLDALLSRYSFNKILIPSNEANKIGHSSRYLSYINVGSIFTNADVMSAYLNLRALPRKNLTLSHKVDTTTNTRKVSWGMTIMNIGNDRLSKLNCIDTNNVESKIFALENRLEIRHNIDKDAAAVTVHCTIPIHDKNNNISDTYHYMALHNAF